MSIPFIRVSCRDEWYSMEHCVTVGDVLYELGRRQDNSRKRSSSPHQPKLIFHGKVLEDPKSILKEQGVKNGDTILIVTDNQPLQAHEALAMFLEMMAAGGETEDNPFARLMRQWRDYGMGDSVSNLFFSQEQQEQDNLTATRISHSFRNAIDLGYHRLRSWWEHPDFRKRIQYPNLEIYRKVLQRHLPVAIQNELSPSAKHILQNQQAWQEQIGRVGYTILQFGDVVLDGLLDIVLDIVQGAARSRQDSSLSSQFSRSSSSSGEGRSPTSTSGSTASSYEPTMEDPFMANQMLYELSESEDEGV